ncbi:hypothetical protein [Stutzerimonas balearica]|uniref:Uracil-DNA glycosylase-like domain-containing protein n=1 Tax=Stutzerimonas balearica TaxID=74829 RepID=A0A9X7YQB9_9GAMM|nr:hypothetical protein [Stutzerimonas balearica]QQN49104.1 hypothetical protein I6H70_11035 [Stutzerimonas balearica]
MDALFNDYATILSDLKISSFNLEEDKYSGVFLPVPFDEYWSSSIKIMLVGRETAGWNTDNNKNTINRVAEFVEKDKVFELLCEATGRYKKHLPVSKGGEVITKTRSRFKQYFFRLAKEIDVSPKSIVYGNMFAWDYNKKSPKIRPENELEEITSISKKLLASQIKHFQPDVVIFVAGFVGIDPIIKQLFNENFSGYKNKEVVSGKYWEFEAGNATCFRIAHPRATHGHGEFRDKVIQRIKARVAD